MELIYVFLYFTGTKPLVDAITMVLTFMLVISIEMGKLSIARIMSTYDFLLAFNESNLCLFCILQGPSHGLVPSRWC